MSVKSLLIQFGDKYLPWCFIHTAIKVNHILILTIWQFDKKDIVTWLNIITHKYRNLIKIRVTASTIHYLRKETSPDVHSLHSSLKTSYFVHSTFVYFSGKEMKKIFSFQTWMSMQQKTRIQPMWGLNQADTKLNLCFLQESR